MGNDAILDEKQEQVGQTFSSLWGDTAPYASNDEALEISRRKYSDWSDGKILEWIDGALNAATEKPKVIDFGCGLGFTALSLLKGYEDRIAYCGIDLFPLEKTGRFLTEGGFNDVSFENRNVVSDTLPEGFDLAIAMGSLHHSTSIEKSLANTCQALKPGGRYIGWIINEQKRLRKATDKSFREFYATLETDEEKWTEAGRHAQIAWEIGEALGDAEITLKEDLPSWELERGTYKIQTLLFDYLVKISKDDTIERSMHQAYDWFVPEYYHQTSRADLLAMLDKLSVSAIEVVTKTNGHVFSFIK